MRNKLKSASWARWLILSAPFLVSCNPLGTTALDPSFFSSYQIKLSAPVVIETVPAAQAVNVGLNAEVVIRFDRAMNLSTLNDSNVSVQVHGGARVSGTVTVSTTAMANDTVSFTPALPWSPSQQYDVNLSAEISDLFQTKLAPTSSSFSTLVLYPPTTITYLVVGGGGGGGINGGGGGGGGGFLTGSLAVSSGAVYPVEVGAGGAPHLNSTTAPVTGGNSIFGSIVALGGGGGASRDAGMSASGGGSGGGGAGASEASRLPGGPGTSGQGNAGGNGAGNLGCDSAGAGGGGAGSPGSTASARSPGSGGAGMSSSITGTLAYYAGGGGSTCFAIFASGGVGGGGSADAAGVAGTGGGGGGTGQVGGSGIVIVSYPDSYALPLNLSGNPSFSHVGGNYIYQWSSVGPGSIEF